MKECCNYPWICCPAEANTSFLSQQCWPRREGCPHRRQHPTGISTAEPLGQQLRRSPRLLSPPFLHKSSHGTLSDWHVKCLKAALGHSITVFTLEMSTRGRSSWWMPGLCRRAHVQSHLAHMQLCVSRLKWITRTDRAAQHCMPQVLWRNTHSSLSLCGVGKVTPLSGWAVANPLWLYNTCLLPQMSLQCLPHHFEMKSSWAGGGCAHGAQVGLVWHKFLQ